MLRSVSAPRSPAMRARLKLRGSRSRAVGLGGAAQETNVASGERIWIAQRTQGNVVRRPFADPADRAEPSHGVLDGIEPLKQEWIGHRGSCQSGERLPSRIGNSKRRQIRLGYLRRRRENQKQRIADRRIRRQRAAAKMCKS